MVDLRKTIKHTTMKGKLIKHGDSGIFAMMDFCYKAKPCLSEENSILEFNVNTDEWWIYEKL
jgi:hypothetical protein